MKINSPLLTIFLPIHLQSEPQIGPEIIAIALLIGAGPVANIHSLLQRLLQVNGNGPSAPCKYTFYIDSQEQLFTNLSLVSGQQIIDIVTVESRISSHTVTSQIGGVEQGGGKQEIVSFGEKFLDSEFQSIVRSGTLILQIICCRDREKITCIDQ